MGQTVMMQIRFSEDVLVKGMTLSYSDALYYTPEQYAAMKQSDIDAVKAQRVAAWKEIVENPAPVKEVTKEELIAQIAAMDEQVASLESQKIELNNKLIAVSAVSPIEDEPVKDEPVK
jgi:seryl-tRNA synthetase